MQTAPILNEFRFEQVRDGFRIVDQDGSVYPAQLQATANVGFPLLPAPAGQNLQQLAVPTAPAAGAAVIGVNAAGTNRGLRQRVQLAGNLVVTGEANATVVTNQQVLLTNRAALEFLLSNSRFEGQALLGFSNQIPVVAFPTPR